jgi:hypothetical protein
MVWTWLESRNVAWQGPHVGSGGRDFASGSIARRAVEIGNNDGDAFPPQPCGNGLTNSMSAADNQRHLACEACHSTRVLIAHRSDYPLR